MAAEAGVPVLPTVIWGSQRVWTKGRSKRLGRSRVPISVRIGAPISVADGDDVVAVTETLRARMTELLHACAGGLSRRAVRSGRHLVATGPARRLGTHS